MRCGSGLDTFAGEKGRVVRLKKWFVLFMEKGKERLIDARLTAKGYTIYCPLVYRDRRNMNGIYRNVQIEPLFPTYMFLHMAIDGDWINLNVFGEFLQVLKGVDGYPAILGNDIIALLRAHENAQGVHDVTSWRYRKGDCVAPKKGPFKDFEAIIEETNSEKRAVKLSLWLLGRKTEVLMSEADIRPV